MVVIQIGLSVRDADMSGPWLVSFFRGQSCEIDQEPLATKSLHTGCHEANASQLTRGAVLRQQEMINKSMEDVRLHPAQGSTSDDSLVQIASHYMIADDFDTRRVIQMCFGPNCQDCLEFYVGRSCLFNDFLGLGPEGTKSWAIDLDRSRAFRRSDMFCEAHALDMGSNHVSQLQKGFSEEERKSAVEQCGLQDQTSKNANKMVLDKTSKNANKMALDKASNNTNKMALWVIGPSASGKTTVATQAAKDLGMSHYVNIDGDIFRQHFKAYTNVVEEAKKFGCLYWQAYPLIKNIINQEKDKLLEEAKQRGLHMVIPHTCLKLEKCEQQMKMLRISGYTNHIVAMWGNATEIYSRGHKRSYSSGKRYSESEFQQAASAVGPMLSNCDGQYLLATTIPRTNMSLMKPCPASQGDKKWYAENYGA